MFEDNYPSIFSRQMEAIVYIFPRMSYRRVQPDRRREEEIECYHILFKV